VPIAYSYKVKDRVGNLITGSIDGESVTMVASKLSQMGYIVINIEEGKTAEGKKSPSVLTRVRLKDRVIFARQFSTMINSGLSLLRSLTILTEQTENKKFAAIIGEIRNKVETGKSLSEAISDYTRIFNPLFIAMIKAGELGGVLDLVLLRIANYLEREAEIRGKIRSAMAYPLTIFIFAIIVAFAIITFILPIFDGMYKELGTQLPFLTQALINLSHVFKNIFFYVILIPLIVLIVLGFRAIKRNQKSRLVYDTIKVRIPLIGGVMRKIAISRFTRTLSTLLSSGVQIIRALDIVGDVSNNALVMHATDNLRTSLKEGQQISKTLTKEWIFPPMVVQLISVGEETGELDQMLTKIADFYDMEVSRTIDSLTSVIEPLMLILVGGIVAILLIAMYLPMFSIFAKIK
jgi:type IV pilus assembly protein PilC